VQAKDVEVDEAARNRYGVFGQALDRSPWVSGWWRYRVPGRGVVDWRRVVDTLQQGGYDGVVSVEHEDPVWSGDPERVRQGLVIAERTLAPLVDV
jgi:sugar phosphate isomerase/epimerase